MIRTHALARLALAQALWMAVAACDPVPALCEEAPRQPFELMRSLRALQDRIAGGDTAAFLAYPKTLAEYAQLLAETPDAAWSDRRNVRAAIAFVLSGGDPQILKRLEGLDTGPEKTLVGAALAYGDNRNAEAIRLLAEVNPRTLDPSIAGHIALVRSELLTKKDPDKALALLADARLLAPGTMIEEAALRREASLAAGRGDADRFETVTTQYLRRYANSVHMANFRRQFATSLATRAVGDDAERRSRMAAAIAVLAPHHAEEMYLSLAWEGIMAGRVDLVRWAAGNAAKLVSADSPQQLRARLFEAAVLLVTDQFDKGLEELRALPTDRLDAEEEGLLAAAFSVAEEIRRPPRQPQSTDSPPPGAGVPRIAAAARDAIAKVDTLLAGARQ
jgi:chemotaxis protein MotC